MCINFKMYFLIRVLNYKISISRVQTLFALMFKSVHKQDAGESVISQGRASQEIKQ